jgi:DNA-binding transcriptional regulator YhcF (GntR family)
VVLRKSERAPVITVPYSVPLVTTSDRRGTLQRERKVIPLYAQFAQQLRQRIYAGEFDRGDSLPSEDALQAAYGVSQSTVRRALDLLRAEGLIMTAHGVGTRVRAVPARLTVSARPQDRVESRMPTPGEREALGIAEGVPVLVLVHPDGRRDEVYDAMRTVIVLER